MYYNAWNSYETSILKNFFISQFQKMDLIL